MNRLRSFIPATAFAALLAVSQVTFAPTATFAQKPATDKLAPIPIPTDLEPVAKRRAGGASILVGELGRIGVTTVARKATVKSLRDQFGIQAVSGKNGKGVMVPVLIRTDGTLGTGALRAAGADIVSQIGSFAVAYVAPTDLARLAAVSGVASVSSFSISELPAPPKADLLPIVARTRAEAPDISQTIAAFNAGGLTGKGVAVAIADTGIYWQHEDFQNADGTTRLLAIWDFNDDSFNESNGAVGTVAPIKTKDGKSIGTIYTREQINAALKGSGKVNSKDIVGHGTACAGTAAGNGRGAGVGMKGYAGVAPDADIIAINIASGGRGINGSAGVIGAQWAMDLAASKGMPCVVNMSYGGHGTAHTGKDAAELMINELVGTGKPGRAICVAAGNENRDNFYAEGRFGPQVEGQQDNQSDPLFLTIKKETRIKAFFDARDDWGFAIRGLNAPGLRDNTDPSRMIAALIFPTAKGTNGSGVTMRFVRTKDANTTPATAQELFDQLEPVSEMADPNDPTVHSVSCVLKPGDYAIYGIGMSATVPGGAFGVYVPSTRNGVFTSGAKHAALVGSPGNADNAITVGSYDFRSTWANKDGKVTTYNLQAGAASSFSSPGFRRDGAIKPDISAPGQYMISPISPESDMSKTESAMITPDGKHLAWNGTSAATPYTAGVVALMLQKNPTLDAAQIADILRKTAKRADKLSGPLPNPQFGYGRIDPAAALAATPAKK